ncbi:N-terminal nucleophile aminohydrolases superfamily protein [Prunus dulcis]|uniref:Proteasome subunit alpha type n=1 Tax=Prunus dulcis TaxID=3755 RepID=A0A4Y1RBW2_PRUDU|nr:N-terminal nucleophile aminohydrolases superfamily protein [Prunus dulcis]
MVYLVKEREYQDEAVDTYTHSSRKLSLAGGCEIDPLRFFWAVTHYGDSQYSFSLTTFSPSGKLVQIEHALTAVGSGQTSLGIKAANGVVIATEKKLPSILVDETSIQKIQLLTPNIGVVYSGMGPDFRVLVRKSRKQAEQYHRLYKEPIPVTQLVREIAAVMQEFTQSGGVRPFGVSLLVAGFDDKGPQLYQVHTFHGKLLLWGKMYTEDMELDDAVHTAILTLKEGVLTPAEIEDYLAEVE